MAGLFQAHPTAAHSPPAVVPRAASSLRARCLARLYTSVLAIHAAFLIFPARALPASQHRVDATASGGGRRVVLRREADALILESAGTAGTLATSGESAVRLPESAQYEISSAAAYISSMPRELTAKAVVENAVELAKNTIANQSMHAMNNESAATVAVPMTASWMPSGITGTPGSSKPQIPTNDFSMISNALGPPQKLLPASMRLVRALSGANFSLPTSAAPSANNSSKPALQQTLPPPPALVSSSMPVQAVAPLAFASSSMAVQAVAPPALPSSSSMPMQAAAPTSLPPSSEPVQSAQLQNMSTPPSALLPPYPSGSQSSSIIVSAGVSRQVNFIANNVTADTVSTASLSLQNPPLMPTTAAPVAPLAFQPPTVPEPASWNKVAGEVLSEARPSLQNMLVVPPSDAAQATPQAVQSPLPVVPAAPAVPQAVQPPPVSDLARQSQVAAQLVPPLAAAPQTVPQVPVADSGSSSQGAAASPAAITPGGEGALTPPVAAEAVPATATIVQTTSATTSAPQSPAVTAPTVASSATTDNPTVAPELIVTSQTEARRVPALVVLVFCTTVTLAIGATGVLAFHLVGPKLARRYDNGPAASRPLASAMRPKPEQS